MAGLMRRDDLIFATLVDLFLVREIATFPHVYVGPSQFPFGSISAVCRPFVHTKVQKGGNHFRAILTVRSAELLECLAQLSFLSIG
jgi:hypothetical protein